MQDRKGDDYSIESVRLKYSASVRIEEAGARSGYICHLQHETCEFFVQCGAFMIVEKYLSLICLKLF
jgi:hypothetical protein